MSKKVREKVGMREQNKSQFADFIHCSSVPKWKLP